MFIYIYIYILYFNMLVLNNIFLYPAVLYNHQDRDIARLELAQQEVQAKKLRASIARRRSVAAANNTNESVEGVLLHYEKCLADIDSRIETLSQSLGIVKGIDDVIGIPASGIDESA